MSLIKTQKEPFRFDDKTTPAGRQIHRGFKLPAGYVLMMDGSVRRTRPKPWRGKSERREVLRERREMRALHQ